MHCGFNLFVYAQQMALDDACRRRAAQRARILEWVIGLVVAGLALTGLQLWLGAWTDGWPFLAALACFYAAGVLIRSLPEA